MKLFWQYYFCSINGAKYYGTNDELSQLISTCESIEELARGFNDIWYSIYNIS